MPHFILFLTVIFVRRLLPIRRGKSKLCEFTETVGHPKTEVSIISEDSDRAKQGFVGRK